MAQVVDPRRTRFLLVGLVLFHLAAISHQVDGGGGASLLQRLIFGLFSPVQRGVNATVGGISEAWRGWAFHRATYEENRRLEAHVRELEAQLQERSHRAQEAELLRDELGLRKVLPLETLAAEVVSRDGVPWFRSLTIDRGVEDGVALNSPIMSPNGVVGRVVAVGPHAARVQLLLDRDAGAGVLIERSRVNGVVSGQVAGAEAASRDLVLKYVPERADVRVGDAIVTSGLDRIYPKGLLVGRVDFVGKGAGLFREIRVEPSARFDSLEQVLVVKRPQASLETPESVQ